MREDPLLQQAIYAARAGRDLSARDIFLEVVKKNPRNEVAWMWLTGLLDDIDDCIYACEMVLEINPGNLNARMYLERLLAKKQKQLEDKNRLAEEQTRQAGELLKAGKRTEALALIRQVTLGCDSIPDAWHLLAGLTSDTDEQLRALEKLVALVPADAKARQELERLRHFREAPLDLALIYEEQGNLEKAIETYNLALAKAKSKSEWNAIYLKRSRIENLQQEKIAHISPSLSVVRLAGGPALLYLSLLLIHIGMNPLTDPEPLLWIGLLWAALGGAMIAFASVRSHHRLWFVIFKDVGSRGTPAARFAMGAAGWILVILPFVLLFTLSFQRFFAFDPMTLMDRLR